MGNFKFSMVRRIFLIISCCIFTLAGCSGQPSSQQQLSTQPSASQPQSSVLLPPQNLKAPAMAASDTSITLIWEKPSNYSNVTGYSIYKNGQLVGNTDKLNYTLTGLLPETSYSFTIRAEDKDKKQSSDSNKIDAATTPVPEVFDITKYGAAGDGSTINTQAIQSAIDACSTGGKVLIPAGVFKSGAIFLKSNMTIEIAENATLLGSENPEDYPFDYKLYTYSPDTRYKALINAYTENTGSLTNIRIVGKGIIDGNGWDVLPTTKNDGKTGNTDKLANKQIAKAGTVVGKDNADGTRSNLISFRGVENVYYGGFTAKNPANHTIVNVYCKNVTADGVNLDTYDLHNADGFDFGSGSNLNVFNCTFDTGDDCMNFGAGFGAPAEKEGISTTDAHIFNNTFKRGHGAVVFGSYTAGWIRNILAEDCTIDGTDRGLRCKTNKQNGGGAENVTFRDIKMKNMKYEAFLFDTSYPSSALNYEPASVPGQFRHINVQNVTVDGDKIEAIKINGIAEMSHSDINFKNVVINNAPKGVSINYFKDGLMDGVKLTNCGSNPWKITNSSGITFTNCEPVTPAISK